MFFCLFFKLQVMTKVRRRRGCLRKCFSFYIWPLDELLWTMHTMLPWGFPTMKTSSQYVQTTK